RNRLRLSPALTIVPEGQGEGGFECRAERRVDSPYSSLVGISPQVRVANAGPLTDAGLQPPWSLRKRSRITLVATERDQATAAEASFYIDKAVTDACKLATRSICCEPGVGAGFF